MKILLKLTILAVALGSVGIAAGVAGVVGAYLYVAPDLPPVDSLREVQLQVPLRVYTRDGRLIAEFGEKRRTPVSYDEVPVMMVQAVTAAEDDRFFDHPGIDYQGLVRAAVGLLLTGEKRQGGSTITMQVARNFFLTREKTYLRKIKEIFLSLRIERELSKQEILELYLNKILLGHRAWGVGAAAEVYYGKTLRELTLAETATIAGLPKAPSSDNPITSPERARTRRSYVLRRMLELGHITPNEFATAENAPIAAVLHGPTVALDAPYLAEMVRADMVERFGADDAYNSGYKVTTSIDSRLQQTAVAALRNALLEYDWRHDYRGVIAEVALPDGDDPVAWTDLLRDYPAAGGLQPAVVLAADNEAASAFVASVGKVGLAPRALTWGYKDEEKLKEGEEPIPLAVPAEVVSRGNVIYLRAVDSGWQLAQIPDVQGAFVSVSPQDGAIVALTGGFDYYSSKFNRAVQAQRQPGSAFKPFIYSAALENGFSTATVVNDAPVVFEDAALEDTWRPENYSQRFYGPTRLREALVRSRNLVSIRILREIGIPSAVDFLTGMGFEPERLPRDLSLALGSITLSPLELATEYSTFANSGHRVAPYYIDRIEAADGTELFRADPQVVCAECEVIEDFSALPDGAADECRVPEPYVLAGQLAPRVLDEDTAWLIVDMMRDVVRRGTASRARELGRSDIAGKTGTTNDFRDAWFSGFNDRLVATVWVGFDQERPLGAAEAGATAALPAWIDYMKVALDGVEERDHIAPPGLIRVKISPESGLLARADDGSAIFELFRLDEIPEQEFEEPVDLFNLEVEADTEEEDATTQPLF
ncbi:MAG: penicillin-binding protein 1A [Gammaproteobacteria bacterium]|nr:penicillin-binding protein 1A [Gammaproteobacteria bacterium]NNF62224.1 penicillin-binding protein 1A [Gammaproteobacteria bacterium]NNM21021.1 penicillin-binding protein 1A [Gammaproteobacteria bacterium]